MSDTHAMDEIAKLMSGKEWSADTTEAIAQIVRLTGRDIADPNGDPALPREVDLPDGPLACPNCGHGESLWSDEPASIMYPVRLEVVDGALDVNYPGTGYEAQDEGTEYVGDIWCRGCGTQLTEAELVAVPSRYEVRKDERAALWGVWDNDSEDGWAGDEIGPFVSAPDYHAGVPMWRSREQAEAVATGANATEEEKS